jgi:hypothetical protein
MTLGVSFHPAPVMPAGWQGGVVYPFRRYFYWSVYNVRGGGGRPIEKAGFKRFTAMRALDLGPFGLLHAFEFPSIRWDRGFASP